ncbi:YbjQ family protein [Mangrovimonas xylaniphaga]|uniref:YbjQ family protein n=1 Tax=Mangrovimonas xylaniphaga TaxID=1645915 RepID=UPI0006B508F5|nr:heavy metal-binding domain-containing protein [Mangrovimonas xylaniphaga]
MILTTTDNIEGHPIWDYLGIVSGVSTRMQKAAFTFNMEKYYQSMEDNLNEVKEEAFQQLRDNALKLKANAVVGIKLDIETFPNSAIIIVSITGTAVLVKA